MIRNKAAILVVWVGKFPASFNIWAQSIKKQPFDFIFITDQTQPAICSEFSWYHYTLNDLRVKFSKTLGFQAELSYSYKLCDYKPIYGDVFQDILSEYQYWGYCDLDMIFGNCDSIIDLINKSSPDKIFERAHLSLIKNNLQINQLYKTNSIIDYKYIYQNYKYCMFDEWNGIGKVMKEIGYDVYHAEIVLDIHPNTIRFKPGNVKSYERELFVIIDSTVKQFYVENDNINSKDFCYIHFQKRKIDFSLFNVEYNNYLFSSNKIIPLYDNHIYKSLFKEIDNKDYVHFIDRTIDRVLTKLHIKQDRFDMYLKNNY